MSVSDLTINKRPADYPQLFVMNVSCVENFDEAMEHLELNSDNAIVFSSYDDVKVEVQRLTASGRTIRAWRLPELMVELAKLNYEAGCKKHLVFKVFYGSMMMLSAVLDRVFDYEFSEAWNGRFHATRCKDVDSPYFEKIFTVSKPFTTLSAEEFLTLYEPVMKRNKLWFVNPQPDTNRQAQLIFEWLMVNREFIIPTMTEWEGKGEQRIKEMQDKKLKGDNVHVDR